MNAARSGERSAANEAANLSRSRSRNPFLRGQDRRYGRARGRVGDQRADGLALVGGEGGDVDEAGDVVVRPGLGDDDAAVGVADEERRAVHLVEHLLGGGDVAVERDRRVLDDADVESVLREEVVDAFPAGAVHEAAVNQGHVAHVSHGELPFVGRSRGHAPTLRVTRSRARASADGSFRAPHTSSRRASYD